MVWFSQSKTIKEVLDQHSALSPLFAGFYESFAAQSAVPLGVLELCRLRIAQLHQCGAELLSQGCNVSESQCEQLSNWPNSHAFNDAERACLAMAEVYSIDVQAISDAHAEAVKQHYGDAGLITLLQALGVYYGLTRMSQVWDLEGAAS